VANSNRKCSTIENLVINGDISFNLDEVEDHIFQFFTKLYIEKESWQSHLDGLPFYSISYEEAVWVERAFEENEVFVMVKDLNG
jgi:hypothetical protein